ncbi:31575_t:CDS:2, partial [Gigaspora margarita]
LRDLWKELKCLMDAELIRFDTVDPSSWKQDAMNNIDSLRNRLQEAKTPAHLRLREKICTSDVDDLTYDSPLANGIIDLGSSQYQITENDYEILLGKKSGIKNLRKGPSIREACADFIVNRDKVQNEIQNQHKFIISPSEILTHDLWVEREIDRKQVAVNITDTLLQEIKRNVLHRVSGGSENAFVDAITRIIEMSLHQIPIDLDIEVTRNDVQSMASKRRKLRQTVGTSRARGNKPDLMVRVFLKKKWKELAYLESGKWKSTNTKTHNDHNKLARFCLDGLVDMSKKLPKNELYQNCIIFGINITDEHFIVIHGMMRENCIKFYLPIIKAKIPFHNAPLDEVEDFVHALLVLRMSKSTQDNENYSSDDSTIRTPRRRG